MRRAALPCLASLIVLAGACSPAPDQARPAWCEADGTLDVSCSAEHCVAGVIIDYVRLEPRGFRVFALSGQPVDQKTAEARCVKHVTDVLGEQKPDQVDSDKAGDFFNCFLLYTPTDGTNGNNWLVTVHAPSGQVVFAGLEIWANPERDKDPLIPAGWSDPAPLGCEAGAADPAYKALVTTGIPMVSSPASTVRQAWDLVKGLNLTQKFTKGKTYSAMVVSYSEATGEFDPEAADWYVYLSR